MYDCYLVEVAAGSAGNETVAWPMHERPPNGRSRRRHSRKRNRNGSYDRCVTAHWSKFGIGSAGNDTVACSVLDRPLIDRSWRRQCRKRKGNGSHARCKTAHWSRLASRHLEVKPYPLSCQPCSRFVRQLRQLQPQGYLSTYLVYHTLPCSRASVYDALT